MSAIRRSLVACSAGALFAVSGCVKTEPHQPSSTGAASATPSTSPESNATPSTSTNTSASAALTPSPSSTSESSAPSTVGPDPANPSPLPKVTPAGSRMKFGQKIVARVPAGVNGEKDGWAYLEVSVTGVTRGEQKVYEGLSNKADFPGSTVWYIKGTVKVLALSGITRGGMAQAPIGGTQSDGNAASAIFGTRTVKDCAGNFLLDEAKIGQSASTCAVAIASKGQKVIGAFYYHDGTLSDGSVHIDDPYVKNPITWMP